MACKPAESLDAKKRALAEEIWLQYFNRFLFEKGVITEQERNRMTNRIKGRKPSGSQR